MRRIVSVSLGSSRRDHVATAEFGGQQFQIERIGTDGDMKRAVGLIQELDGRVDAIGIGGIDLHLWVGSRRYTLRGALPLVHAAKRSPIVDGTGLKNTLERHVVRHISAEGPVDLSRSTVLIVCAADRFGLAESLAATGARLIIGDLMFGLGLPLPLRSLRALDIVARGIAPVVCRLPFEWLYPTGKKQDASPRPRFSRYYQQAAVIAGDFHFIRRYMPDRLDGKTILTNTVTQDNIKELRERGVSTLITTTPELGGRSFGTNVMEAVLIALAGKPAHEVTTADYERLLGDIGFRPRVQRLEG